MNIQFNTFRIRRIRYLNIDNSVMYDVAAVV